MNNEINLKKKINCVSFNYTLSQHAVCLPTQVPTYIVGITHVENDNGGSNLY